MSFNKISYEIKENIVYIGFGVNEEKSMTTLGVETLKELDQAVDLVTELDKKGEAKGLVFFSHKPDCFLAGVNIDIINNLNTEDEAIHGAESGQNICNKVEDLRMPTVACIDGVCLGGGLELALSCNTMILSDNKKTKLALPEVKLGVLPGFGGTYRLPKRVGLPNALDMMLTGKMIDSRKAQKTCLADFVMPKERLLALVPQYIGKRNPKFEKKSFKASLIDFAMDNFVTRKIIFQKARDQVLSMTKGFYPAPLKILELLENNYGRKRKSYLEREARAFGEMSQTEQSKNLVHLFFLHDASKKLDSNGLQLTNVRTGAVLGAGTMGGGIAWLFANNDQKPYMKDITKEALELGLKQSSKIFGKALKKRKITSDEFNRKQWSIVPTLNYDGFKSVDLVIEAVVENMDLKKKVFAEVEKEVGDSCIITSNTSSLKVTDMATALTKPERFAGLHFFNPVNMMPLVEIVTHDKVSDQTVKSLYNWCLKSGKTPIVVKDGPGFLVNRILAPFLLESMHLLSEGVSMEAIDKAVLNFGMPMGACRLLDEIGIDVSIKVCKIMEEAFGAKSASNEIALKMGEAQFYGKKNGKGFYTYGENGKPTGANEEIKKFLPAKSIRMDETIIQMRLFLPMINEAANILEEGLVDSAATVDLGLIFGIGFPPFRGGLLKYADSEGLDRILGAIKDFSKNVNKDRYQPSKFLEKMVADNTKFYDLKPGK